ncbi:MAG: type I restriction enzyme HsdR N-terminal domain-containing protein [Chitinophagaceae bacterium]|nr:type I restriction enzyme HsdR N-terminal domain-containing protein [Chitinophagaceae bacterium]MBL0308089.1 type I restriction enzyme HsdR N-terminal domain-containing protein [Chitinophagaceae bacterium]HQV59274.1 type I restriction enzyme HsdR N-terminal domain-containing protein [Chitinophagaceae bacterium]HQV85805.1 type I restriction enzyme HsdR N-terminal domain-containing protein [Chitinophagaceae bacterium]HQZ76124.1 type I restriction enzyme HsdR N-terminal domain-containing protei
MINISYPEPAFRIKKENGKEFIFDPLRKKWLVLTPEEWVRQNFLQYLLQVKKYPAALIAVEKEILLGELKKRFDILVYNKEYQPWMMVECKAMEIKLDEMVLEQVLRYNISVPVEFMVITNGNLVYAWQKKDDELILINELPV